MFGAAVANAICTTKEEINLRNPIPLPLHTNELS